MANRNEESRVTEDGSSTNNGRVIGDARVIQYLYKQIPISLCVVDLEGKIADYNKAFSDLVGNSSRKEEDMVGESIFLYDASRDQDTLRSVFEKCKKAGKTQVHLAWIKSGQEAVLPVSAVCSPLSGVNDVGHKASDDKDLAATGFIFALTDWSEPYKFRKETELANEDLRNKEKLKNEFIAVASHELRTPIQPILGFALLAKMGKISNERAWESVLKEARRLQQLANDILDVSKIESRNISYQFAKVSIREVIESAVNSLRPNALPAVSLEMSIDGKEGVDDLLVEIDKSRMTQVLTNIIGNSLKFTKSGFVKVEASAVLEKNRYVIRVSDTGGGIQETFLPSLFQTFATNGVAGETLHGTGLGLYISRAIVVDHGGAIYVHNDGGGSIFTIQIPITRVQREANGKSVKINK